MERYRGYRIEQTENGFRITLDDGSGKHTHIKSKSFCKRLIDFVVDNKVPHTENIQAYWNKKTERQTILFQSSQETILRMLMKGNFIYGKKQAIF